PTSQTATLSLHDALPIFWIGEILNRKKNYPESEAALNKYMALAKTSSPSNPAVNPVFANYIQGYNYIRTGENRLAIQSLQRTIRSEEHTSELQSRENLVC